MTLKERIEKAFTDPSVRPYADTYLSEIRTTWREAEKDLRRTLLLAMLLSFVFELVSRGGIADFSIGFAKLTDTGVVRGVIPLVVAYLINAITYQLSEIAFLVTLHETILVITYKPIVDNDLEAVTYPANSLLFSQRRMIQTMQEKVPFEGVFAFSFALRALLPVILLLCFEVYAYEQLLSQLGFTNILLWFSMVLSLVLVLEGILMLSITMYSVLFK
jgi:hypothetical protein